MHDLGKIIYFMRDNKVFSAPVLSRMIVENLHEDRAHTKEQKELYTNFGLSGIFYYTTHGVVSNLHAFGSKKDLLDSL